MNDRRSTKRPFIAMPTAHLMALAPLDVWARLLFNSRGVRPRYWLRLAFVLFTSFVGMACCVHERVILFPVRMVKFRRRAVFDHPAGVVVVVGYYRSGTTHLHNLLSCDPRVVTPRWFQVLGPQGFWFGWTLIRVMLVPFLGSTRPQDGVAFGPEWPAEDDFALCNWGLCSTLPGRFVFPSRWARWSRWNTLVDASDRERNRWRSLTAMFCWKITRGRSDRVLVLKTPSHTGRIAELDRLFGGNVRFVHIARDPTKVIDSNVNMHDRLASNLLEDAPQTQVVRDRIVEEYGQLEMRCAEELATIPENRVARVRLMDLTNDPLGTLQKVYKKVGLRWDDDVTEAVGGYIRETGEYRTPSAKRTRDLGTPSEDEHALCAQLRELHGLDADAVSRVELPHPAHEPKPISFLRGVVFAMVATALFGGLWLGVIVLLHLMNSQAHMRIDQIIWGLGAVVGLVAQRAARKGSVKLGVVCIVCVLVAWVGVLYFSSALHWDHGSGGWNTVMHNFKDVRGRATSSAVGTFGVLAMVTAFRLGSRQGPRAPGR
ncbi:MAG: sulfotransferase [Phycisphaerales bacterium]|nr:sulfotransferase [Phycisphaerales bacterium]